MTDGQEEFQARIQRIKAKAPTRVAMPEPELPPEVLEDLESLRRNKRGGMRMPRIRLRIPGMRFGLGIMVPIIGYAALMNFSGGILGGGSDAVEFRNGAFVSAAKPGDDRKPTITGSAFGGGAFGKHAGGTSSAPTPDLKELLSGKGMGAHAAILEKTGVLDQVEDALSQFGKVTSGLSQ